MTRQQQARAIDADLRAVEAPGDRAAKVIASRIRRAIITAYRDGQSPAAAIGQYTRALTPLVVDAMTVAHLRGAKRAFMTAAPHMRPRAKIKLSGSAYDDALDFLAQRLQLTAAQRQRIQAEYGPPAAQAVEGATTRLRLDVESAIRGTIADGGSVQDGMQAIRAAFGAAGLDPEGGWRLETIFRTQSQIAYNAGRWAALQDDAIQEILWGYEYNTVGDDRVRPAHAAMDGRKYPKDDPIWDVWWPPCGYNCRCSTLEIFTADTQESKPPPRDVAPDPGFAFNPGQLYDLIVSLPK